MAILVLSLIPTSFLVSPVSGSTSLYTVAYNPYAGVDWNTILRLKTQLHAHTILGGGGSQPYQVINNYAAAGFDALGISDYNRLTWPWSQWDEHLSPAAKSMVPIPNEEVADTTLHFTAPFITAAVNISLYKNNAQGAIDAAIAVDGIPIIAHPTVMGFDLTTCDSWTGFQGIEIYNPTEGGTQPFDFQLWDHLLTDPARADKHIWGFAVDDSHDTADINQAWIVVYATQKTEASMKNSIIAGSFVAVVNSTDSINNITQVGNTLTVDASSSVVWKADGEQVVGTDGTLDLDALGPGYTYVRAEVGDGEVFTQPIFITQTRPYTIFSNGFEDGFASWDNLVVQTGTVAQSSDTAHSGLYSAKITGIQYGGDKAYANKSLGASYKRINIRAYVNFSSDSTTGIMMGPLSLSSPDYYAAVVVRNFASNRWGILTFNPLTGVETYHWENGTSAITIDKWHYIELEAVMSVHGFSTLWIDGAMKLNVTNVDFYTSTITSVGVGEYGILDNLSTVLKYYVDDVVVSDSYIGPIQYSLTVGVSGHGTTNATGTFLHDANTNVTVLATPDTGYFLNYWLRNGTNVGSVNPYTINMTANYNLTAMFSPIEYNLYVGMVGNGIANVTGTNTYAAFTDVPVLATPDSGYYLVEWLLNGSSVGSANPYVVSMVSNYNLTVVFAPSQYSLEISTVGSGSVTRNNTGPYDYGDRVQLTAVPAAGWNFSAWSGDLTGSVNPVVVSMDGNKSVTATFSQLEYTLVVTVSPLEGGSVGLNNSGPYYYGGWVRLTATANSGWSFSGWSGDVSGTDNPIDILIDGNKTVTASFTQSEYSLTITVSPLDGGSVNLNNTGPYHYGDVVELTAVPAVGYGFNSWSGDLSGSANPTTITIDGNKTVTANFVQLEYKLTVIVSPLSGGSVNLNNSGPYNYGDKVELTAVPTIGWTFASWSGDLTGSGNPSVITMTGNKSVTAIFSQSEYTLAVDVSPLGSGSVSLNNTGPYHYGNVVELTAVPSLGWSFSLWSGDLSGSANPITITMNGNKTVTATFTQNEYTLTVIVSPVDSGSVSLNVTDPYHYGDGVRLTAVPTIGWAFFNWTGDLSGSGNPAAITMNGDKVVAANFVQLEYALTVTVSPIESGSVSRNNTGPYHYGDWVRLTAVANSGWSFSQWSGDASGTNSQVDILIDGNKSITANFIQTEFTLTVSVSGQGSTNATGSHMYPEHTNVTVLATPDSGWMLDHWTLNGTVYDPTNPFTVNITADYDLTAVFTQIQYSLTVAVVGNGVTNATGTFTYNAFTNVTVLATADSGYFLDHWLLNGTNVGSVNPYTVNMTADYNLTAVFMVYQHTLTVIVVGQGTTNATGIFSYDEFSNVTVLATPDLGYKFDHWVLNGSDAGSMNPYTLNMTGDFELTGVFTQIGYSLFVGVFGNGVTNVTGTQMYPAFTDIPVLATPDSGYYLVEWLLNGSSVGSANPYVVSTISNYNLTAVFAGIQHSLTVNVSGSGATNATGTFMHDAFTNVTVLATPDSGYFLDYWMLNGSSVGSVNPYTVNMTANFVLTAVFRAGALIPLSGWQVYSDSTNALYVLNSDPLSLYLQLNATDTSSRVTIFNSNVPKLVISDFVYVDVTVSGTDNARIVLRFFLDDGSSFDVVYWRNPATLNAITFDLSPYAGRKLSGTVYLGLMSSDGTTASITIIQMAFVNQALPPLVPLSSWSGEPDYSNALYAFSSGESSLFLELEATDTSSKVTIGSITAPKLSLSNYVYVHVSASGTDNARLVLRFFLDDGSSFDVVYWQEPASLNAVSFDLSPYAGRKLNGLVYIGLMSSDGTTANITITGITFVNQALPPSVPLSGWNVDAGLTNAPYVFASTVPSLYLELDATNTGSKVVISSLNVPKLNLSDFVYVNVTILGTDNARITLRFFLNDGSSIDVVYWQDAATLDALTFDLSPYAGRKLSGSVYIGLMSSDGTTASITIMELAFATQALPPFVPLSAWSVQAGYSNAPYALSSSESGLFLQLDAVDVNSKVTIGSVAAPNLNLTNFSYVDVTVSGTGNARLVLRFFLDDGSSFDVVYWSDPAALNATSFSLSPYTGRKLSGLVYLGLMSSDGTTANITITEIAFKL